MRHWAMITFTSSLFIVGSTAALAEAADVSIATSQSAEKIQAVKYDSHISKRNITRDRLCNPYDIFIPLMKGITLSERQRQQMRDLMASQRQQSFKNRVSRQEREILHNLMTADIFDDVAFRVTAEKLAQDIVEQQVEIARIYNQFYKLLTHEQKIILEKQHQKQLSRARY
ncbi:MULTISPECIES: Spy/CpxP family protein refolding chaperone [unclassified Arsenophonus]|uniref:Spy/CpxP family protein refolding chaperone n=1 Tax=unclassified Arsenophonus TaxID=2627083 RepID=UPI002857D979|nr:Spy/CpxP family protein refolding chaperone [Arsenophonus sp.]MDR5612732.1 Spy/CpxP family protein refolding chaperone [Arsenophonus sp.]MDR5618276.1 Spy/CpxP family protein refolding chaperone [Arsenophonus sp.]